MKFLRILPLLLLGARPAAPPPTFTELNLGIEGYEVRWGDCDNDGHLDLAIEGFTSGARFTRVYKGNGAGVFTLDPNSSVLLGLTEGPCIWGDYDNDGDLDLAYSGWSGGGTGSRIYRNDGNAWVWLNNGLRGMKGADGAWFDYDNDGDLDLLLTGESYDTGMGDYTIIYRNDGNGVFTPAVSLPGTYLGEVSVGDFDHDGYIDVALTGRTVGTKIFRNNGNGTFSDIGAGLPSMINCSIAFGDFDNDGDLDIVLSGEGPSGLQIDIYRNDNGTFVPLSAGLPAMRLGHVAWGDYDNDGFIDLLMVGSDAAFNPLAFVYRNNGNGTFSNANLGLTGVAEQSTCAWGDFDNDGDLDIVISGTDSTGTAVVKVYRNDSTVANTPPTIPTGLAAAVVGKSAALSWNASTDTQTPAAGLTYNLRVGTTPGGQQVKAPMADLATGLRRIPASGNAQQNLSWTLKKLPPGTYYWSVQAIDNGFLASGWSAEASFTVTAPVVPVIPTVTAMAPAPGANLSSKPASISITLSAPIDPATVGAATVKLVGRGVDGLFGTADDVVLTPASIGVAGSVITLDLTGVTMPDDLYRVTLDGTPTPPATFANLFARWKMTEGTGGTLPDSSGNGRNGTLNGATWGSGLFGNALVLAGGGGRVDIDAGALTPDWSAAMWVCRTAATAGIASSLMDSNSTTGTSLRLEQYAAPNDVGITEYTVIDQGFGYVAPIGTWVHLTFVSDALTTQLYVNGVFESSAPRAYNLHVDKIGTARTIATHSPYCLLNDFQVYTRVLSPAEMTSLVTLGGCIKSTTGGILNGEYTGSFPSGDASPGGDFNASFGINIPSPPTAFTMTEPANGSIGVSTLPTFTWNSSVGATSYRIQVATDAAFLFPVEDQVVVGTSFTPASGLAFSNAYYWRVTANNLAGGTLATGAPFLFTTGATIDLLIGGCGLLGAEVLLILALLRRRIRSA